MRSWQVTRPWVALLVVGALGFVSACGGSSSPASGTKTYVIGTVLIAKIDFLQTEIDAFKTELARKGVHATFIDENADGQVSNVALMDQQVLQQKPDLVFAIGTAMDIDLGQRTTKIPIVFGAMTDPVGAKVVQSLQHPGGNLTGATDAVPSSVVLKVITQVLPNAKTIGVIFNPSEQNDRAEVADFTQAAQSQGISVVNAPVTSTNDVQLAVQSLSGRVQALLIPASGTVVAALQTVTQTATRLHIPTFGIGGAAMAAGGTAVAFGVDYTEFGVLSADYAARILLNGAKPADLPVIGVYDGSAKLQYAYSTSAVTALGLNLPSSIKDSASPAP